MPARDASLTFPIQASIAAFAAASAPGVVRLMARLVNRLLPGPNPVDGHVSRRGGESRSPLVPGWLNAIGDRAAAEHNQLGPVAVAPDP